MFYVKLQPKLVVANRIRGSSEVVMDWRWIIAS